jgi:hypothetical protein
MVQLLSIQQHPITGIEQTNPYKATYRDTIMVCSYFNIQYGKAFIDNGIWHLAIHSLSIVFFVLFQTFPSLTASRLRFLASGLRYSVEYGVPFAKSWQQFFFFFFVIAEA